jgi:small-conductance mechanosensitive channel
MAFKIKLDKKGIFWFIVSYIISLALIWWLSKDNFFKSPMYILLPIVGFFALYYFTKPITEFANLKKTNFLIIFTIVGIIGFIVAIYFYYWNYAILNNLGTMEIMKYSIGTHPIFKGFITSAYLEFLISGIIGILAAKK